MGLGGKKGAVTPHERNPNPGPTNSPKMSKKKMKRKKKKKDIEELKKEVVMVRRAEEGAGKLPSKVSLNPQPSNISP